MAFSLNDIFQALVPKDKKFFPLIEQASENMYLAARTFNKALHSDSVSRLNAFKEIAIIEQQGDEIIHVIMREVAATFITPIDREDIQFLAAAIDDVADYIHGVAKRIELYKIVQVHPVMPKMAVVIEASAKELNFIISTMHKLRYTPEIETAIGKIRVCEKQIEELYDDAISSLFAEDNAIEILKLREVFSLMSSVGDKCEETASVIESVLVKFS